MYWKVIIFPRQFLFAFPAYVIYINHFDQCLVLLLFIILDNFNFTYWIPTTCLWIFFHKVVGPFFCPRCRSTLGPSWSYDSWIFNYLCNHYLLPLNLWVRTSSRQGVLDKHYGIKFDSNLWHVGGFFRVLRFPPPIYNWNMIKSGVKQHVSKRIVVLLKCLLSK